MAQPLLALFLATSGHSGVDRVMRNLIIEFARRGLAVDLLKVHGHGPYLRNVPSGVRIIELGSAHVNSSLVPLVRYLRREKPAALLSDKDKVNRVAITATRLARVATRSVVRIGTTVSVNLARRGWPKRQLQYFSIRRFYPRAAAVIVPSRGAAEDLSRIAIGLAGKIHVIPSPAVNDEMRNLAAMPAEHPWFLSKTCPVILGVGELCERKDFDTLVQAFALVRQMKRCRLVILGEGRLRNQLLVLIENLGLTPDVSLPGFVKNPYAFMKRAALFVLSSRCEGAPVVLMEALALGLPSVATDCPSGPREILHNGRYGRLVKVGDVRGLAEAIMETLENPLPHEALAAAAADFHVSVSADRYLEVLLGRAHLSSNPTIRENSR